MGFRSLFEPDNGKGTSVNMRSMLRLRSFWQSRVLWHLKFFPRKGTWMKLSPWHFAVEFRTSQGQLQRTRQNPSGDQQVSVNEQKKMRCFGFTTYLGPILDSSSYLIVASTDLGQTPSLSCPKPWSARSWPNSTMAHSLSEIEEDSTAGAFD